MLKVIVIGCPGAGKSTFARRLRDVTNLPLYYLDMLWHKTDKTNISKEEFDARLSRIVKKGRWNIDFPKTQLPYVYELLKKHRKEKTIVVFKSRKESEAYLSKLRHKQFMNQESKKSL